MTAVVTNKTGLPMVLLSDLITEVKPGFAVGERDQAGVIQVRMNNVDTEGNLDLVDVLRVPATQKQMGDCSLSTGDVLFNNTNSTELVGKSSVFRGHSETVTFSNHFTRLRVDGKRLNPFYLARWLTRQQQLGVFQGLCTRWVGQSAVRSDKVLGLKIPLPPLLEQGRIVDILDKADEVRRKRCQVIDLHQQLVRSSFASSFGDLTRCRSGYSERTLSEIVRPGTEVTYGIVQCGPHVPDGVPYIRASDMTEDKLDITKMGRTAPELARRFKRSEVRSGELVFSIRASVGAVHLVPPELDGANLTQGTARIAPGEDVNPGFLLWALRSGPVQAWVERQCKGTTFREITLGRLRQLPFALPPKSEQDRFARLATKWDEAITRTREAHLAAVNLFRSLVQRAFRGEL